MITEQDEKEYARILETIAIEEIYTEIKDRASAHKIVNIRRKDSGEDRSMEITYGFPSCNGTFTLAVDRVTRSSKLIDSYYWCCSAYISFGDSSNRTIDVCQMNPATDEVLACYEAIMENVITAMNAFSTLADLDMQHVPTSFVRKEKIKSIS